MTALTNSPTTGDLAVGKTVTLTLKLNEAVTISGGTPTLTLNDGGVATYASGSGTNTLTFTYTVGATNTSVASLLATAVNLNGATVVNGAGTSASLSLTGVSQSGPQIDTATPTLTALTNSPASGNLAVGKTVTLTLKLNEAVTISGGTPTLTLNDGGVATYASGSGTNTLTFTYTVGASDYERRFAPRHGRQPQWRDGRQRGRDQRQPVADRRLAERPTNRRQRRHADRDRPYQFAGDRQPRRRQDRDAEADAQRGGDGFRRDADVDPQRRRRRHLFERFGHQHPDFHLYSRGVEYERRLAGSLERESERRDDRRRRGNER